MMIMTRKKSNVKALALAVTCAILAGGGIGLEPVYAADVTYDVGSNQLKNGTTAIDTLTVGGVTIGGSGTDYGSTIGDVNKHVMISDHDISATGSVHASIISSGINARMSDGKVVAQNGLYIGYDGTDITKATYDNSRFAVNGENGSFKAANGKFTVSGSGAITADSLALTGTDGTTNVGAAIKDNANNIQAVNGQVTNIKTDVTSLQTTTGQLQTKVGELTASDTAARNDIISLQKKTAGISEDGSEITTNSLKLRESGSSEEQEITAAKVKGYDKAVAAVGDTSTEGTLAYNTQKIKFKKDNKITSDDATYIEGITHAGGVRLADGAVRAKSIVLEEEFANGTSAQATLTREAIVNLNGMTDGKTKIKVADGSEVGGVTFEQGKVTNVVSINDNLKFESDGIYLNKGDQAKQIKIGTDGKIIIGTSSSAYDTNGFYAGGDDYTEAKAAIDGINGKIKGANGAFNVDKDGKTTFTKDADNLSSINGGNIWAKATDIADNTSSELTHDYKGLHIKGNKSGQKSAFDFDTASGIGTFTGQDNSTTQINGSAIRSEKIDGTAGKLDGENLTLYKDPNNQTTMSAGKATFTGDAGEKGGKVTTINGGTISTDTLNVERINLGEDILDSNGNPHGSNLSMDKQGNFSAAGGNFKVTGGSGADKGAFTNTVGNTTLQTDNAGASMKFDNTAATGGVESKVTVEANKATVAAGEKASFVAAADNGGTATITGGTQTVTTTDNGTVFENSAHKTAFVDNGATNTIINGNEITTGKITTDQLVITGKGNADGNGGSIAFGGNGTIKSDINDGTANGQKTSFETTLNGVNTKVTDGTTTTENKVTAEGNSNTVKQDDTHKSEFNQGLTSIGGVVTNGEIKVAQKLDGATGLLTNEVTNADGSSKLEQSGTGLTYTDSAKPDNATRIDSSDVSIGSATNDKDRINLSDLGQIDDLDQEIRDNEVYKNNETAVGGINAEAAIRRGEVERLDNRISEEVTRIDGRINDVNDRVNKVGAMAAAIASLKSIGYDPQAPSEFSIGLGQYKGETGVAMGFFHYPNKNFMINVSLSTAGGETMGGIGATWRFGHKSPQKLLEEQREEQAKKELAAAEKYQAAAKLAKEAQERAEYAAKLARQAQVSADNAKAAADATQAKHFG
jgi:hypothetical protein